VGRDQGRVRVAARRRVGELKKKQEVELVF
jgi:hypothetical protein